MNRATAEKLMEALAWMECSLDLFEEGCSQINDERESCEMRKAFAKVASDHFTELMVPIIKQYPDLDPDKFGKSWYQLIKKKYETKVDTDNVIEK